jgi:phenylacetate-CoA ligase
MIAYLRALTYYAATRDIYTRPRQSSLDDQWNRVQEMVAYAYAHVPFYRTLWRAHNVTPGDIRRPSDMDRLPVVTKASIRAAYPDAAISDQFERRDYKELSTSGSTGEPFKFVKDKDALGKTIAINYRTCTLSGYGLGRKVVQVAPPISGGSQRVIRLVNAMMRREVVDTFAGDYESTLNLLDRFQPTFLVGYASYLHILAKIALDRAWHPAHPIIAVMTTSETLLPQMRATIEEAFNTEVFDQYGSNEFGRMAGECGCHRGYHINTDAVYIEVLDLDADTRVAAGQSGRLVMTGLVNRAMPLIRYEIGDTGALAGRPCACDNATPLLVNIGGRLQDVLWHANGTPMPPDYLYRVLREYGEIQNYQIVQRSRDLVQIRVVCKEAMDAARADSLRTAVAEYLGCDVVIDAVAEIPRIAGKFKHIISNVDRP